MKHIIKLKENETIKTALDNLIKDIEDDKKPNVLPGKAVFIDNSDKVLKVTTITGSKNRVEQSFKEQLDINRMLDPVFKKGLLRHNQKFEGQLDDIPVADFQEAMFIVAKGKSVFEELPSQLRNKFGTPTNFLEFVQNPANKDWLKQNGMLQGFDGITHDGQNTGYTPKKDVEAENAAKNAAPEVSG